MHLSLAGSTARAAFLGAFLVSLLVVSGIQAQLSWEKTAQEVEVALGQDMGTVIFPFENAGEYPVTIVSTRACCGSSVKSLDKQTYHPGEKGEIVLQASARGRIGGLRRYTVEVRTDDASEPVANLAATVKIPEIIAINPRLVYWRVGQEPEKQIVRIQINPEVEIKINGIEVSGEQFQVVLKEGEKPNEYLAEVTPLQNNLRGHAIISLQTDPEMENRHIVSFYAHVR